MQACIRAVFPEKIMLSKVERLNLRFPNMKAAELCLGMGLEGLHEYERCRIYRLALYAVDKIGNMGEHFLYENYGVVKASER